MCEKLIPLLCAECGRILGASFNKDFAGAVNCDWLCRNCLTDIGSIADTIAVITEQDPGHYNEPTGLPNIFSMMDASQFFDKHLLSKCGGNPITVLQWCHEQREKLTKKKANKFP